MKRKVAGRASRPPCVVLVRFPKAQRCPFFRSLLRLLWTFFSGANDSAEMFKLQNPLFQHALKEDPHFATQVKSLELMLRVRDRVASEFAGETSPEGAELVRSLGSGFAGSVDRELQSQDCVPARRSGPSVRLHAPATRSLVLGGSESSLPNSDNSSMGVACVDPASAAVASFAPVCSYPCSRVACAAGAVHARRTVSPMHDAYAHSSWSGHG